MLLTNIQEPFIDKYVLNPIIWIYIKVQHQSGVHIVWLLNESARQQKQDVHNRYSFE